MRDSLQKSLQFIFLIIALSTTASAQHEAFIYGEIEMNDHTRVVGKITWSAGQTLWVDLITVEKKDNPALKYLNAEELKRLSEEEERKQMDWGFMALWENQYPSRKLTLRCQFGHIASITITGSRSATITLKNGERIRTYINGDAEYQHQLGDPILVNTPENEKVKLAWDQILKVRFILSPRCIAQFDAEPLYGTILTKTGFNYTGLIKWDMDEHLNTNYVDGKTLDGKKVGYPFKKVRTLRPKDNGSLITLASGKEIYLTENSNVTNKNNGILIRNPLWGQVIVRWSDFKRAEFTPYQPGPAFAYKSFEAPHDLVGSVTTADGAVLQGHLFYDLDEKLDIETVDGWDEGQALRQVPFRLIDRIYPVSKSHTVVWLKNNQKLVLGERSDVDHHNWGILVKMPDDDFKYVPWEKVQLVKLK